MSMSLLNQDKGAALVGAMLVLLVLTLLGSSAFLHSQTEQKISSNYHQSLQALYAAEAGLQQLLSVYRQKPDYFFQKKNGDEMGFPTSEPENPNGPKVKFWIEDLRYDPQETPTYVEVIIHGKEVGLNSLGRIRAVIQGARSIDSSGWPLIFQTGLISAGAVRLDRPLEIKTDLHAEKGFFIEPSALVEQLRLNGFSLTQSLDSSRTDWRPSLEVPRIDEKEFDRYRLLASEPGNRLYQGSQNLTLSGDQKGLLIFVDGDLLLTAQDLSGLTLVVKGSLTLNGSSLLNGKDTLDAAFITGGDIILSNFSQIAGLFWANGSLRRSGTGRLSGTVVCQGDITDSSGFQFERNSRISAAHPPQSPVFYSFRLGNWSQV